MRRGSIVTTVASGVLAAGLLVALIKVARVDIAQLGRVLADVEPFSVLALFLLIGMHNALSAEKWRLVERSIAPGSEHSRRLCFCFTAVGTAAGQLLPTQLATALARSLGSRLVAGGGAVRGAAATVVEQMFDLVVVAACGLVSLFCLWGGDLAGWPAGAAIALVGAGLSIGPVVRAAAAATGRLAGARSGGSGPIGRLSRAISRSGFFDARLARRLFVLSVLRLAVLWLMAIATTRAAGLAISSGQLAAALPLVVLATALPVTPGGIGVNEWTFAAALTGFGVDFATATQCALVNRALVAVAALAIGAVGLILAQFGKGAAPRSPPSAVRQAGTPAL